jgi:hypothetical protein
VRAERPDRAATGNVIGSSSARIATPVTARGNAGTEMETKGNTAAAIFDP